MASAELDTCIVEVTVTDPAAIANVILSGCTPDPDPLAAAAN